MKKLLLLLTTVLLTAMSSLATTATLVTSDADLKDGASYIIACPSANYAMTGTIKTSKKASYFTHTTATISGNTLTVTDAMAVVVLEKSGANWKLKIDDQYMQCTAEKKIKLAATGTAATIDLNNTNGIIYFGASYGYLKCNSDKDQERFSPYKSGMKPVALYKIDDDGGDTEPQVVETPVFSVAAGAVEKGTEVSISCATEGASIHYTTDGSDVSAASPEFSAPIVINEAKTIKAIAVKDGMTDSPVATAAYTIKADTPDVPGSNGKSPASFIFGGTGAMTTFDGASSSTDQSASGTNNLSGKSETVNGVTLSFSTATDTNTRWWTRKEGNEVRMYKNNSFTVSMNNDAYVITSIDFTHGNTTSFKATDVPGTLGDSSNGKRTWTAPTDGVTSVTFTADPNNSSSLCIGFTSMTVNFVPKAPVLELPAGATEPMPLDNYTNAETNNYFEVKVRWPEGMTLHYKTNCRGTQLDGVTLPYSEKQKALDFAAGNNADKTLTDPLTGDLTGAAAVSRSAGTNTATFGFASQGTFECYVVDAAGNQSDKKPLTFQGQSTGVEDIVADGKKGEAVYYNLQGVRVANPAAGNLYIKVQGDKATKVLVK